MTVSAWSRWTRKFETALLSIDRLACERVFFDAARAATPLEAVEALIAPVLAGIGEKWEQGTAALSQVYMSGRICEDLVTSVLPEACSGRDGAPRIAIAVLEDRHVLGKRIVCSLLRANGFPVIDYGSGVTADELVSHAIRDALEILLLSVLMLPSALRVRRVKEGLLAAGASTRLVVGGAPFLFDERLWVTAGADAMGRTASDGVQIVRRLSGHDH